MLAQQRQRGTVARRISPRKAGTANQQTNPFGVHKPRQRAPCQPQHVGGRPRRGAKAADFHYWASVGSQRRQIIGAGGIALVQSGPIGQYHYATSANQAALSVDHHMLAQRVISVGIHARRIKETRVAQRLTGDQILWGACQPNAKASFVKRCRHATDLLGDPCHAPYMTP